MYLTTDHTHTRRNCRLPRSSLHIYTGECWGVFICGSWLKTRGAWNPHRSGKRAMSFFLSLLLKHSREKSSRRIIYVMPVTPIDQVDVIRMYAGANPSSLLLPCSLIPQQQQQRQHDTFKLPVFRAIFTLSALHIQSFYVKKFITRKLVIYLISRRLILRTIFRIFIARKFDTIQFFFLFIITIKIEVNVILPRVVTYIIHEKRVAAHFYDLQWNFLEGR